jgi:hypothetical protein
MTSQALELKLDRSLQNEAFQSWKLSTGSLASRKQIDLPGAVAASRSDAIDYVHTRAAVLRNHLISSGGRYFIFLAPRSGPSSSTAAATSPRTLQLVEAVPSGSEAAVTCTLLPVAGRWPERLSPAMQRGTAHHALATCHACMQSCQTRVRSREQARCSVQTWIPR